MKTLHEYLTEYGKTNAYAFHMPGHKGICCDAKDITEIDGFDDLHEPEGIILGEMERISNVYSTKKSYILVGGSTLGNLVSIFSSCSNQGDLIIDRSCHKSVYNASVVARANLTYMNQFDLESVKQAVSEAKSARALVITAPTYEGYMPDVGSIADIAHEKGKILIVDAAHGAHLGFDERFPESPVSQGADIVVMSLHKTLPALTMTAVLHVCSDRVSLSAIEKAIDIFETSSPSYLLMDSVSCCMSMLESSENLFSDYYGRLMQFYDNCEELENIKVDKEPSPVKDPGKIRILSNNPAGLYQDLIEKYHLQPEMKTPECVLMMTSICDTDEGFNRLFNALREMDQSGKYIRENEGVDFDISPNATNECRMPIYEAVFKDTIEKNMKEAASSICGSYIIQYPPGSPIVVPGEVITEDTIERIKHLMDSGVKVTGLGTDSNGFTTISVVQ